ncbi:PorP/SprF family type IX secretion system membrane protein [Pedobacter alpinus]|uniref:PorP/SprF family type IX secretion system membrane protein n=2 Tax=Pedobacter alpinus TaxID=1590643 RepID=A0ABW5TMR6_9SPHI
MEIKKIVKIAILLLFATNTQAQDHIFSQFYNAPIYLNPALTGQFDATFRMNMTYRNQWSSIAGELSYITASADLKLPNGAGGVGIIANSSSEGMAALKKNSIAGVYSYIVGDDRFSASFGLQAGVTNRSLDFDKLVFSDQLDPRLGFTGGSTQAEQPFSNSKYYFDTGAGANFIYGDFMLGGSLLHLNKPDESFTGSKVPTPVRTAIYTSYKLALNDDEMMLIPSVVYYNQAKATAISAGMQFKYNGVNAGLWYRTGGDYKANAVVLSFIFDIFTNRNRNQKMRLGVSHDAPMNKLNYGNTSGTTELSVGFETGESRQQQFGAGQCFKFY